MELYHQGLCILMMANKMKIVLLLFACCGLYMPHWAMKSPYSQEQIAAAWRYNTIQEKKFFLRPSQICMWCNQSKEKSYNVAYVVNFYRDRYDALALYLLETLTENVRQGVSGEIFKYCLKFDTKTWNYAEVDVSGDGSDLITWTPRFEVSLENPTSSGIQKVLIKNLATNETVIENHEIDGDWYRLSGIAYFPQDLIVTRKKDYSFCFGFKVPILKFSMYALNPWDFLRDIKSDFDKSAVVINPQGTQFIMVAGDVKTGQIHFHVVEVSVAGYEKLTPRIKGHDVSFRFAFLPCKRLSGMLK